MDSINTMKEKNKDKTLRGRNSVMVGMMLSIEDYSIILEQAEKKGMSIGLFLKAKVHAYAHSINTTQGKAEETGSINTERQVEERLSPGVYPLYNPAVHKAGEKVLMRQGKRLVLAVVPELDGAGEIMPV